MKTKKIKTFDCVEMKRRIQADLMDEYESRKDQFSSFADFIHKTAALDFKIRAFQEKVSQAAQLASSKRKTSNMKSA
jgi:hypothetical protein